MKKNIFKLPDNIRTSLHIGPSVICAVKIKRGKDRINLLSAGISCLKTKSGPDKSQEDNLHETIQETLAKAQIKPFEVSIISIEEPAITRVINLPKLNPKELKQAVKWEVERHIPLKHSNAAWDWQILDRSVSETHLSVLIIAVREETIKSYLNICQQAGIKPKYINLNYLGTVNLFLKGHSEWQSVILLIPQHINTSLSVIDKGKLLYSEDIPLRREMLNDSAAIILQRIKQVIHYYEHHFSLKHIEEIIIIDSPGQNGILPDIGNSLGLKVRCVDLFRDRNIDLSAVSRKAGEIVPPSLAGLMGLGLKRGIRLNFMPASEKKIIKVRKIKLFSQAAGVAFVVLILLGVLAMYIKAGRLKQQLSRLQAGPAASSADLQQLLQLNTELEKKIAVLSNVLVSEPHWSAIMNQVVECLPQDVWLTQVTKKDTLTFSGISLSQDSVTEFITNLTKSVYFTNTNVNNMRDIKLKDQNVVQFAISCEVR